MYGLRPLATKILIWVALIKNLTHIFGSKISKGNKYDLDERERLYEQAVAAKNGHPGLFNGNVKKALTIFGTLIAQNSTDNVAKKCGYQLGEWYLIGVPRINNFWKRTFEHNFEKSIRYLSIAAKFGEPRSNYLLSFIYHILNVFELNNLQSSNSFNPNIINLSDVDSNKVGISNKFFGIFAKKFNKNDTIKNKNYNNNLNLLYDHLRIAAKFGDVMALSTIGYNLLYADSDNHKRHLREASKYYKEASKIIISGKDGQVPAYTLEAQLPVSIITDDNIHLIKIYAEKHDDESNMDYWQHKAMKGDALAQYELAKLHDDDKQAEHLLAMAANKSHAPALRDLGLVYLSRNNIEKAIKLLTRAADLGDADAAAILAYILLRGNGGAKNFDSRKHTTQMGIKYLIMACKQNVPDALFLLAEIMSFKGKFSDAKWLYERAGDYGFIQAIWAISNYHQARGEYIKNCFDLKLIADSSPSVSKYIHLGFKFLSENNYTSSLICFLIASFQGSLIGQLNSSYLCRLVKDAKIKIDKINLDILEQYLLVQALMQGSTYAFYPLAKILDKSDIVKSVELYKKSFLHGDCRAIIPLVKNFYLKGETDKAIELLQFYNNILKGKKIGFIGDILKDGRNILSNYVNRCKVALFIKLMHFQKKIQGVIKPT